MFKKNARNKKLSFSFIFCRPAAFYSVPIFIWWVKRKTLIGASSHDSPDRGYFNLRWIIFNFIEFRVEFEIAVNNRLAVIIG